MQEGFIFNDQLCVNCNACKAACILENRWKGSPREIITFNHSVSPNLPVIHLSLACNHCLNPVCMTGCPSGAYSREPVSDAVIVNEETCIGCNYCTWNCPYDAPKPVGRRGVIEKCNLCWKRLAEGLEPACTSACPTGALKYGSIPPDNFKNKPDWFPDKGLRPALFFSNRKERGILKITPEPLTGNIHPATFESQDKRSTEWSLVIFTFLVTCSVSLLCSSIIKGIPGNSVLIFATLGFGTFASIFHLGKKLRAIRAVCNVKDSPLSREIVLLLVYAIAAVLSSLFRNAGLIAIASGTGLILLAAIDGVYYFPDKPGKHFLTSGQVFISGLLITSLFANTIIPFLFIASVKLVQSVRGLLKKGKSRNHYILRFIRFALLLISSASLASGVNHFTLVIYGLILTGEFLDRIIFYQDFKPLNINLSISENIRKYL